MFARGRHEISKNKLDWAYSTARASIEREIERRGRPHTAVQDMARQAAARLARQAAREPALRALRKRLKENRPRFIPVGEQLESLAEDALLAVLTGQTTSTQAFKELLDAVAMDQVLTNPITGRRKERLRAETVAEILPHVSIGAIERRARVTPGEILASDREVAELFRTFARVHGQLLRRVFGWRVAFPWLIAGSASDVTLAYAVPAMGWLRERFPKELDAFVSDCPRWIAQDEGFNALLDFLPEHLRWAPDLYESFNETQMDELHSAARSFAAKAPEHYGAIFAA
jgi:hypothetical protein